MICARETYRVADLRGLHKFASCIAVAIACAGPLPLWLHHSLAHSHTPAAAYDCVSTCACSGHEASEEWLRGGPGEIAPIVEQWNIAELDCSLCYQLGQLSSVPWEAPVCQERIEFCGPALYPALLISECSHLHLARGPPQA
jgi:hypothetical protein